ncbi:hypothetical protein IAV22_004434, partial [Salmonella enterica]|nr:hypothetical protein [Salmonella enterica]
MKTKNITLIFNDIVTLMMWDESHSPNPPSRNCADGQKVTFFLQRLYTASKLTKFKSRLHYVRHLLSVKAMNLITPKLLTAQQEYLNSVKTLKRTCLQLSFTDLVDDELLHKPVSVAVEILPCPPVLTFIRISQAADEANRIMYRLYKSGAVSPEEYFDERKVIFKLINELRKDITKIARQVENLVQE